MLPKKGWTHSTMRYYTKTFIIFIEFGLGLLFVVCRTIQNNHFTVCYCLLPINKVVKWECDKIHHARGRIKIRLIFVWLYYFLGGRSKIIYKNYSTPIKSHLLKTLIFSFIRRWPHKPSYRKSVHTEQVWLPTRVERNERSSIEPGRHESSAPIWFRCNE